MDRQEIDAAVRSLAGLFQDKSPQDQRALLAALERAGAGVYRALASEEEDAAKRDELLAAAGREEQNAELLERAP